MNLPEFFTGEKDRVLAECEACGLCVKRCPITEKSELAGLKPKEVQKAVLAFLDHGEFGPVIKERLESCMECYGCVKDVCPKGLNPLQVLHICRWEAVRAGLMPSEEKNPKAPESTHRILADLQTTPAEYRRITTSSKAKQADTVFFPGCNVYFQPEKLLNALDVMERLDPDFAFAAGLDNCCGICDLTRGRVEGASERFDGLLNKLLEYGPKNVVLWCPTCFCLMGTTFADFMDLPFEMISMAQYVGQRLDRLDIPGNIAQKVTVHDACKLALTGLDVEGCRAIIRALGADLVEMQRVGAQAACCGCAAIGRHPRAGREMLEGRVAEAVETGAEIMTTVCHYCNQMLASCRPDSPLLVESYINLLAGAMGIHREDRFRKYMAWGDPERILADAEPLIARAFFPRALLEETVRKVFTA